MVPMKAVASNRVVKDSSHLMKQGVAWALAFAAVLAERGPKHNLFVCVRNVSLFFLIVTSVVGGTCIVMHIECLWSVPGGKEIIAKDLLSSFTTSWIH